MNQIQAFQCNLFPPKVFSVPANDNITFKIISSHQPTTAPLVNFRATTTDRSFLDNDYSAGTQRLASVGTETNLEIRIAIPASGTGDSGTVKVELLDGTGYTLADSPNHETTANLTTGYPIVSITGNPSSVTQGHPFSFTVEATTLLQSALSVPIDISTGASTDIITSATPSGVYVSNNRGAIPIPISGSVEVTVMTQKSADSGDTNGSFTIYNPSGVAARTFRVEGGGVLSQYDMTFKDNTASTAAQPRLSIANLTDPVRADQSASADFTITGTRPRQEHLR